MSSDKRTRKKVEALRDVLKDKGTLLIVMQDFPDPDAIGSGAALRELANSWSGTQCSLAHGGVVGRGENRAMVRYLGLNLREVKELDYSRFDAVAMVDTQPGSGNNSFPDARVPDIVVDHHPIQSLTRSVPFTDIRSRYGATCTILYEYLRCAGLSIEAPLATALLYGIRSDTQDLGRESTQADIDAFLALYPLANKRMLSRIENSQVPRSYFGALAAALENAVLYGSSAFSDLGEVASADMVGEAADLLLRNEETQWVLCCGCYGGVLWLSLRTSAVGVNAGKLMQRIVRGKGTGGGHSASAGGQIPVSGSSSGRAGLRREVVERFLRAVKEKERKGQPLLQRPSAP